MEQILDEIYLRDFVIRVALKSAEEAFFYFWKHRIPAPEKRISFPVSSLTDQSPNRDQVL